MATTSPKHKFYNTCQIILTLIDNRAEALADLCCQPERVMFDYLSLLTRTIHYR
jgi:hypothetical protein